MKILKIFFSILLSLSITGCYNKAELDNYAYVIGLGFDVGEEEGNINITYQIAIPVKIAGEDSKSGKETFTTYTTSATSINAANSIVNSMTSKEVDLSHTKIILYSEELARSDLTGHINSLISNIDIRPKTSVAICRGKAEDFLKNISPILEVNPAKYYELILSSFNYTSESIGSELVNFYSAVQSIDREAVVVISELIDEGAKEKEGKNENQTNSKNQSSSNINQKR